MRSLRSASWRRRSVRAVKRPMGTSAVRATTAPSAPPSATPTAPTTISATRIRFSCESTSSSDRATCTAPPPGWGLVSTRTWVPSTVASARWGSPPSRASLRASRGHGQALRAPRRAQDVAVGADELGVGALAAERLGPRGQAAPELAPALQQRRAGRCAPAAGAAAPPARAGRRPRPHATAAQPAGPARPEARLVSESSISPRSDERTAT